MLCIASFAKRAGHLSSREEMCVKLFRTNNVTVSPPPAVSSFAGCHQGLVIACVWGPQARYFGSSDAGAFRQCWTGERGLLISGVGDLYLAALRYDLCQVQNM